MLKAIPNLDGYYASSDGRIWSTKSNSWRKPFNNNGYLQLRINGETYKVHRLIALAFIPNPYNLETVDHVNEDKTDNRPENLRWMTRVDNKSRSWRKRVVCETTGVIYNSIEEASKETGCHKSLVCRVCKGERQSTNGLKFSYMKG